MATPIQAETRRGRRESQSFNNLSNNILPGVEDAESTGPRPIYIVSSEREAETIRRRGCSATSTPRPWSLQGVWVVLVPAGPFYDTMRDLAIQLLYVVSRLQFLFLPGLLPGEDVRIWFATQSAEDSEDLFRTAERVEITSQEGIRTYLKEPIYPINTTSELAEEYMRTALMCGMTPREALEATRSMLAVGAV